MAGKLNALSAAFIATVTIAGTQLTLAQEPPPATRPAGQQGMPAMPGAGDPMEAVKTQIKATAEEWQVIGPAIRKVVNARRTADGSLVNGTQNFGGGRGGFGGRGGRGGFGGPGGGGGGPGGNDAFGGPANNMGGGRGGMRGGPGGDGPPQPNDNAGGPPPQQAGGQQPGGPPNAQGGQPGQQQGGPPGGGMMGGPPGMGGFGGGGPVANAMNDLKTVATEGKATADEIKAKIETVRAERKKARDALNDAVEELKAVITPEQEAVLIGLGYLE